MGGLFKKKSSKQTTNEKSESQNLFAQNKQGVALFNQGIAEGSNMNIPGYELADYNSNWYQAAQGLQTGQDYSYLGDAAEYMGGIGQSQLSSGLSLQNQALAGLSKYANQSQADWKKGYQAEYNSDLVKDQISGLTSDVNDWYMSAVQGLNQNAVASGNMGSSRAGVAQGVLGGQAAKAIASGSLQYRTQEENNAFNRYNTFVQGQQNTYGQLASIGQNQISTGANFYSQGMNYQGQMLQGNITNQQNALYGGSLLQQQQQYQLDIQRQNALLAGSPALARLQYMSPILSPLMNSGTTGSRTTTTIAPAQGNGLMGGLLGTAGAVVGGIYGGPMGAQLGASLGGAVGGAM
ncbi:TPA: hypothetical protein ACXEZB_004392 [Escherichia coli]